MKKILLSFIIFISVSGSIFSQGRQNSERVEAFKIAYFTQNLSLSPEEAKVFWPVYNAYTSELEAIKRERNKLQKGVNQSLLSDNNDELEDLSDEYISLKQKEFDVSSKFHQKFKEVLPIRKVILLYKAEQTFKQELLKEIRKRRQERMGGNRPQGRRRN